MNIISPKTIWLLILLVAISSFLFFDHEYLYTPYIISRILFIIFVFYWFFLNCSAFFVHHEAYKNSYATSGLVTHGIYKRMRHPMYVGDIVLFLGLAVFFPMMWVWVTVTVSISIFFWFMSIENAVLRERFGRSFSAYKKRMTTKKVSKEKNESQREQISKKRKIKKQNKKPQKEKNQQDNNV